MTNSSRTVSRDGESSAAGRGGRRRVDLEIARREVAALAKSLSLTETTRYVSMLQLSGIFNNETANPLTNFATAINRGGGQIDLQIPIFDTGAARTRAAR